MWWRITIIDSRDQKFFIKKIDGGFDFVFAYGYSRDYSLISTDELKDFVEWIKDKQFFKIEVEAI